MPGHTRQVPAAAKLIAAAAVVGALSVSFASAEVSQKDGVRVSVTGKMAPTKLPRSSVAPIAVSVAGHIVATKAGSLPKLKKIAIAINGHGKVDLKGLPLCRLGHINPSTDAEALAACRSSLIGEGSFSASVKIPEQSPFPSQGHVLAFNGRLRGKPAIFAHIYGTKPIPASNVLAFSISKTHGTYGTVLEASLPEATGEWGYVTGISLNLDRTYTSHGKTHSYLSATCPAPKGFPGAVFPLARTTFSFDGELNLTSTLNRSCKVKG
jgi:hypothetical protein